MKCYLIELVTGNGIEKEKATENNGNGWVCVAWHCFWVFMKKQCNRLHSYTYTVGVKFDDAVR